VNYKSPVTDADQLLNDHFNRKIPTTHLPIHTLSLQVPDYEVEGRFDHPLIMMLPSAPMPVERLGPVEAVEEPLLDAPALEAIALA